MKVLSSTVLLFGVVAATYVPPTDKYPSPVPSQYAPAPVPTKYTEATGDGSESSDGGPESSEGGPESPESSNEGPASEESDPETDFQSGAATSSVAMAIASIIVPAIMYAL